ncbi:MAG: hypothetical protein RBS19_09640 [Bacteroidales bacterium]|nr:hypothetical protein [Bacteroidales bacterium]
MNSYIYRCIKINFVVALSLFSLTIMAQRRTTSDEKFKNTNIERPFFTGGNFGLQFGTITAIDVSPILGYRFTENFAVGIGATYQYYRNGRYNPAIQTDIYGGRVFVRFYFLEKLFLHGEAELINFEKIAFIPGTGSTQNERIWENNLFLGGGYRQLIGEFTSMHISILYNFNQGPYSPFSNPQIRIGFDISL